MARSNAPGLRQQTQFTCMATSLTSALNAFGKDFTETEVNAVMGCRPKQGASWEMLLNAAQYFGMRGTLVVPSTIEQLKAWTDAGTPVVIAWNPEGRPWSHASVVVDVTGTHVHIMDPNIPDPNATFRIITHAEFYKKWGEEADQMIVRRPACAIEREVTEAGKQVDILDARMPSTVRMSCKARITALSMDQKSARVIMAGKKERQRSKDRARSLKLKGQSSKGKKPERSQAQKAREQAEWNARKEQGRAGLPGAGAAGKHRNKQDFARGHKRKPKHRGMQAVENLTRAFFRMASIRGDELYFLATDGNWYLEYQHYPWSDDDDDEYAEPEINYYGPFKSEEDALRYKRRNLSNTGGSSTDSRGRMKPPRKPISPGGRRWASGSFWKPIREGNRPRWMTPSKTGDQIRTTRLGSVRVKISRQDRAKANQSLSRAGLDGNGRFRHPSRGYSRALDVLSDYGIELDEIVSSHQFRGSSGVVSVDLAYSNKEDSFSPVSISNSVLHIQFTELRPDVFEVVAYLS